MGKRPTSCPWNIGQGTSIPGESWRGEWVVAWGCLHSVMTFCCRARAIHAKEGDMFSGWVASPSYLGMKTLGGPERNTESGSHAVLGRGIA